MKNAAERHSCYIEVRKVVVIVQFSSKTDGFVGTTAAFSTHLWRSS